MRVSLTQPLPQACSDVANAIKHCTDTAVRLTHRVPGAPTRVLASMPQPDSKSAAALAFPFAFGALFALPHP